MSKIIIYYIRADIWTTAAQRYGNVLISSLISYSLSSHHHSSFDDPKSLRISMEGVGADVQRFPGSDASRLATIMAINKSKGIAAVSFDVGDELSSHEE